eukprot:9441296-Alexandrium_andersonii.AAC.1
MVRVAHRGARCASGPPWPLIRTPSVSAAPRPSFGRCPCSKGRHLGPPLSSDLSPTISSTFAWSDIWAA